MTVHERQNRILELVRASGHTNVKSLAKELFISESSVRRDVRSLEERGYLKQIYGGVMLFGSENGVVPIALRDRSNSAIKDRIAEMAAEELFDGATVILDGSSTVRRIMKYVGKYHSLKIITNNLRVFAESVPQDAQLFCTGGEYDSKSGIFVGRAAEEYIRSINADILFFSSQALSEDGEISDASEEETALRRVMLSRSLKSVFLCDSSKLGKRKTYKLADIADIHRVVCDKEIKSEK